ncbi:hypothetical protein [Paraburkholderia gardini]|uniref:hypothetical protein n=1 Tax=Paraburkholderia gardini TaxID=2823469 RepID=UPI001E042AD5|nr:hypothetical protein [Paraburkholderia gardini]CAG4889676.1 hypothetical protein R69919_00796 [Paraburkholderia gardini]
MSGKSHIRKYTQPAMSPLLRALTFSRAAHEPVTQAMLLQCYAGLDAFRRGHGSRELFTTLGRQLLVAEELCRLGYESDDRMAIQEAHAAMMQIDTAAHENGIWAMSDIDYAWLCFALDVFARQLAAASLESIAMAEAKMIEGLLTAGRLPALAETSS